MSYSEEQFKREVINNAQKVYSLNELKFNVWTNNNPENPTSRTDYVSGLGSSYVEPATGDDNVTVSSLSSSTAWKVYEKSNEQAGDMMMGRLADTKKLYEDFGLGTDSDAIFNLTPGKKINVQKLKDWTVLINDCWMLGAIHKHRTFNLVSKIGKIDDIWDTRGFFVVTGRELFGLMNFGYKPEIRATGVSFVCKDTEKASSATLTKYAELVNVAATKQTEKAKIALFAQGSM